MKRIAVATSRALDAVVAFMGFLAVILVLYCMIFGVADVFMRYALNSASLWIGTTLNAALVLLACTAGIYAYHHGDFIRLDLFYAPLSPRVRAILDVITAVFSFAFLVVLIWKGWQAAMFSIKLNQMTPTAIPIPIYPIKTFIPIIAVLMLLLVTRRFWRDLRLALGVDRVDDAPAQPPA